MAKIYPQWITEEERKSNTGKRAEYLLYDLLSSQLGDEWLIIYGAAIKWVHRYGVSDRETEFLVAHPKLGVLALEIKGGSIKREAGRWFTAPLSQIDLPENLKQWEEIKNPYNQVTDAAKSYRRKINDYISAQHLSTWDFEIGTAVCFPDIAINDDMYLGAEVLPEITIDCNDLQNLKDKIFQILMLYQKRSDTVPPGETGVKVLKDVLARDWMISSFLTYQLQTAEDRRKTLTSEQFDLLYNLQENTKMLVSGCAGSGKTMIAAKKAQLLAQSGAHTLLTCFNENLASWIKESDFSHPNLRIAHFHGLCREEINACDDVLLKPFEEAGFSQDVYYQEKMPEALELAALERNTFFDAIIVDEGQDFEPNWLMCLQNLLNNQSNGVYYIFYDDNQRIYTQNKIPFQWPHFRLTRNLRNANPIFEQMRTFYHSPQIIKPSGINGPEPWFIEDFDDEYLALQDVLEQLERQKIPLTNIVVLTPREKEKSRWSRKPAYPGRYLLTWNLKPSRYQVSCSTIYSFKGLERPVIILTELDHLYAGIAEQLLYVAISRAKDYLIVLGKSSFDSL